MSDPAAGWNFSGQVASTAGALTTLVDETSFCVSSTNGDITPGAAQGLFFLDTRFISHLELRVGGHPIEVLAVDKPSPFAADFVGRPSGGQILDPALVLFRRRNVGRGLVDEIELRNHASEPAEVDLELLVDADFADLFAVKEQRAHPRSGHRRFDHEVDGIRFGVGDDGHERTTVVTAHPAPDEVEHCCLRWRIEVGAHDSARICIEVSGGFGGEDVQPRFTCRPDGHAEDDAAAAEDPVRRMATWRAEVPVVDCDDPRVEEAIACTAEDLGGLRIVDPAHPADVVIAAGAPWYMTLFGRDALLTSYMALMVDPQLALGVLRTLARLQGTEVNPETEEEPGRILHEIRFGEHPSWNLADGTIYYGTVDATPLFVILLGELRRWGLADDHVDQLLPAADRALRWLVERGDRDGDGFIEYERSTPTGLANQGWKDSWDAIRFADGRFPEGPIALCEVQAYTYAAYLARAYFADEEGDQGARREWTDRAHEIRARFREHFWLPDRGWLAMALDGDKQPVDALASNMGHALWAGIVDEDIAPAIAARLVSPEMFSGWGIRTMASSMAAYNPVSYHLGSVWPHDNALCVAGLVRYGFVEEAHKVIDGLLDVASHHDGRLPELIAGIDRTDLGVPAVYPTSCMPQAWSAATPLLLLRSLLRFDPWMRHRQLWVSPTLPHWIDRLVVENVPLDGARMCVSAHRTGGEGDVDEPAGLVEVSGLAADVDLHSEPRHPLTAALPH